MMAVCGRVFERPHNVRLRSRNELVSESLLPQAPGHLSLQRPALFGLFVHRTKTLILFLPPVGWLAIDPGPPQLKAAITAKFR